MAGAKMLLPRELYVHIFMFFPTNFFSNQVEIGQFENKSGKQKIDI